MSPGGSASGWLVNHVKGTKRRDREHRKQHVLARSVLRGGDHDGGGDGGNACCR